MKFWFAVIAYVILVTSIAHSTTQPEPGVDGYVFSDKEFTQLDINLRVVYYDSIEELQLEAQIKEFAFWADILAFSEVTDNYCEVHIVDPAVAYHPERLGHEIAHCLHGNWHPRMDTLTITLPGEGMPTHED